jgi:hypothetical protein
MANGHRIAAALIAVASVGMASADTLVSLTPQTQRYANTRYGTVADFPIEFEVSVPPSDRDDGRRWFSDGTARISVSASNTYLALAQNFEGYTKWVFDKVPEEAGFRLTYKISGKGWLVYSGYQGDTVIYRKIVEACRAAHELRIEYPVTVRAQYDGMVTRVAKSLTCKRGAR